MRAELDSEREVDPPDCAGYISRGTARYHAYHPECEADYRAAFLLDAQLAATEVVQRLEDEIRSNVAYVLMSCRKHLAIDPQDVVARVRLGLTLLLLHQDGQAFTDLQQAFLQGPAWRPSLRLMVNAARRQRTTLFGQILQNL
jgi:hypothetical protein